MTSGFKTAVALLLCSTLSAVGAVGLYDYYKQNRDMQVAYMTEEGTEGATLFHQPAMRPVAYASDNTPQDFVEVAERSLNGVVNIRSEVSVMPSGRSQMIDPFEFFFGPFGGSEGFSQPHSSQRPTRVGIGSGVIISEDGYIITNHHVVANATKITVTSNDNREWEAKIIGTDPATDIALVKIEAQGLQPLPFGDSEKVRVGEWVLAIGNPFNLSSTVTAGIVSAKGRSTMNPGELQVASFIQTDAAVNPGNSGGALVNTAGELIGINTMIYSETGNFAGYSFAVPVSIAAKVVGDIKKYGAVQRAVMGIVGVNINSDFTKKYDLKVTEGAVVAEFSENSPAKSAGMKEGDVVTHINGTPLRSMAELQEQVSKYRPGDKITVIVNRKGEVKELTLQLVNTQGTTEVVKASSPASLGATFKPLSQNTRKRLGIDYGIEVASVERGKLRDAGIMKGFVILSINNTKITSSDQLNELVRNVIANSPEKVLFIKGVHPSGKVRYIAIDLN